MKAPRYDIVDLSDEFQNTTPTKKDVAKYLASIAGNNIFFESADGKIIGVKNDDDKIQHIKTGKNYNEKTRREIQNKYKYILSLGRIVNNSIENKESQPPRNQNAKPTVEEYHYFRSYIKIGEKYFELKLVIEEFKEIEKTKKIGEMRAHTSQEESQSADSGLNHTLQHSPYNDNTSPQQVLSTPVLYVYDIFETYLNQRIPNPEEYIRNKQYRDAIQTYQDTEYALELLQQEAERKGITLQEDDLKITYDAKGYPEKLSDRIKQIQQRNTIQKETHNMENENTRTQEQQKIEQNVTNTLIEKIRKTGLDVIIDKEKMREILDSGQYVQKMAAYHGTSHENESETFFNGYGTYVVSVNENYAKQHGLKIASKKYGDTFYVKEQTLNDFLSEHNFSPYWNELIRQSNFRSPDELHNAMMIADTKGNAELERQKGELSTLFKYSLIEYKKEQTYLYSVDIPDNTGKNYLLYNNPIGLENANRINAELEKMNVEWKVSRNDTGRQVYFDVLSKNLFNGNQKTASEFLKNCGYVGMEMDSTNYIVFDENDMNVKNRLQYMIDGKNNVLGLAAGNAVILDPDFLNSNTPAHEYNHFWDRCIRQSNPELIAKGIDIFKETDYWSDVEKLQSYKEGWSKLDKTQDEHGISNYDYEVFSEMHSRIVGQFASEVLTRIAVENGGDIADAVIDWDKEAKEYIAREFGNDFPEPELGSETYEYDSEKQKYIQDFFAQPMKDLMSGIQILQKNDFEKNEIKTDDPVVNYELGKIQETGIKVNLENGDIKETLAWLNEVNIALKMLEEEPVSIQLMEDDLKTEKSVNRQTENIQQLPRMNGLSEIEDMQDTPSAISTHIQLNDNTIKIQNQAFFSERFTNLKNEIEQNANMIEPKEFLNTLKEQFDLNLTEEKTGYAFYQNKNNETFKIRISNHNAILKNRTGSKTDLTSVVIQLCENKGRNNKNAVLREYVYHPDELTKEKEMSIVEGITSWINTGIYTGKYYDEEHISTAAELKSQIQKTTIQQHAEPIEQNNITNQKENTMENQNTKETEQLELSKNPPYYSNLITMEELLNIEISESNKRAKKNFMKAMKKVAENMNEKRGFRIDEVEKILLSELPNMDIKDEFENSIIFEKDGNNRLKAMSSVQFPDGTEEKLPLPANQLKFVAEKLEEKANKIIENGMSYRIYITDYRRSYNEVLEKDFLDIFKEYYGANYSYLDDTMKISEIDGKKLFNALEEAGCAMYWSPITKKLDIVYMDKAEAELGTVPEYISFDLHSSLSTNHDMLRIHEVVKNFSEKVISEKEHEHDSTIIEEKNNLETDLKNNDFINTLNESEQAINEATNGMGHDPTDGLPLDFDPPLTQEQMDMWSEIAETEGNTHSDEVFDMYETKDGKLFYPEEIVPPSVEESLRNVYQENEVDTTAKKVDAYASEIYLVLSNFSKVDSNDWGIENKTEIFHLSKVAGLNENSKEESIEKIKEYFVTETYAKEKDSLGKTFSEIIKTKKENGYTFDFALKRGEIKSILGNEFSGGNIKLTKQFQDECIKNGLANPKDEFIIVSENEAKAMGTKIKQDSPSVTLTIPVKTGNETRFVETKYYHVSALEETERLQQYQKENTQESLQENAEEQKAVAQLNSSVVFGKTELPPFALITKDGLQNFDKCIVESFDNKSHKYIVKTENGNLMKLNATTFESIVNPEKFNERVEKQKIESVKKQNAIIEGKTKIPEFAMITQHGLQTFKDMTVEKYNAESKSWTLSNADGQSVNVTDRTLKELTSDQRIKQVQKFTNDTLARDKMLVTQYNDYFKQRDNTAYNFRHNLSVYCRKEANSPVDALKIASIIIKEMPVEERRKTKELLNTMRRDGETVNQVIANMYTEAVKDVPLNEAYIANNHHDKKIARPMYDTLSVKGEKIDRDFNLKIGDNISNMAFKMGKTFGIGKETLYQNCTIVSASKEGNVVTLMDGNKSYYDVPRDTFLKEYARQQKHEQKLENHQQRQHRYNMQMSVEY